MTITAERFEDMSPRGRLRVIQQDDGDMIIAIIPDLNAPIERQSVEFCTSGGKSPRTLLALRDLMHAIALENEEKPTCYRRGEWGIGVDSPAIKQQYVRMPTELTAENGVDDLLIGEFFEEVHFDCCDCNATGISCDEIACEKCNGTGQISEIVYVEFKTIQAIYRKIVEYYTK